MRMLHPGDKILDSIISLPLASNEQKDQMNSYQEVLSEAQHPSLLEFLSAIWMEEVTLRKTI